jgi:hypothetical protein
MPRFPAQTPLEAEVRSKIADKLVLGPGAAYAQDENILETLASQLTIVLVLNHCGIFILMFLVSEDRLRLSQIP